MDTDEFKPRDKCGVFGIYNTKGRSDVAHAAYYALYSLQHRGQESCGICVGDDGVMRVHKDLGLVPDVFDHRTISELGTGNMAIGHVRYSTTGAPQVVNAQPIVVHHVKGSMAIAHNGNVTNDDELRAEFELDGAIFHTTSDTEVIAYAITRARLNAKSIEEAVYIAMGRLKGAYSLVLMSPRKLIAARDPNGFRPLCLGKVEDAFVFASESCAITALGGTFIRDVHPGEIIVVSPDLEDGYASYKSEGRLNMCVFEYIYVARTDSYLEGYSVHKARRRAGHFLAKAHPVEADVVIGMPDSGLDAALGYAEESGIPYGIGLSRNRYIGRTFIQPTQAGREEAVHIKLTPIADTLRGKRVIVVDDSIVRGTTTRSTVMLLRKAGAKEVHVRISSPPFRHPCYFGIDVDNRESLIANRFHTDEDIAREIGADSVGYLSVDDVRKIADVPNADFCVGCFSGEYPIQPPHNAGKKKFETKLSEKRQ
ncbi:MAG: amidophosphoribosyltransferase [Oscillospiraceae bacterium]|jgi:amidophosphoribosyltransferase|nr:amidophosphoribosyltransferase [Oscillospiraceae bacterium]